MMTSPSTDFSLPVVTISEDGILPDQLELLRDACAAHGFFLLKNSTGKDDGYHILPERLQRMWEVAAELFDASLEDKMAVNVASSSNNRGYFSNLDHAEFNKDPNGVKIKDNKEGFFFGSNTLIAPGNRAPAGKERLLKEVEQYMDQAREVCTRVMKAIVQTGLLTNLDASCNTPQAFADRFLLDPVYMLKTLKYPPTDGNTDAHTDYGCVTLLLPGDEGLQVHYKGAWYPVPLVNNAFVINFGDLLQFWSGGAVKSTIHRVIYNNPTGRPRYSIPFFMHPQKGSKISNGTEAIDSYSYVLSRFDATYKHRAAAAAAAKQAPTEAAAIAQEA